MVEQFVWKDALSTKIGLIDAEHKRIIEVVQSLKSGVSENMGNPQFLEILESLQHYCKRHFIVEEEYMALYEYPELEAHTMAHEQFNKKVENLYSDMSDEAFTLTLPLLNFIVHWLEQHIMNEDLKMAVFLRTIGVNSI